MDRYVYNSLSRRRRASRRTRCLSWQHCSDLTFKSLFHLHHSLTHSLTHIPSYITKKKWAHSNILRKRTYIFFTASEDALLKKGVKIHSDNGNWPMISKLVGTRSTVQCRQRWHKVLKPGLRKSQWNDSEDELLRSLVQSNGTTWAVIAEKVPGRTPKQCRERWKHHLDPRML